jgi:uncharacterized protein (TIGR03437 family)
MAAGLFGLTAAAWGGTFGTVVALGGHATDLALDESRGVVYVANYTANRVDVVSASRAVLIKSMNVSAQPSGLALSRDSRYLVVTHYANYETSPSNGITVFDLDGGTRRTFSLRSAPFGVAFASDDYALVATATEFIRFDPLLGTMTVLSTVAGVTAKTLPQDPSTLPTSIISAAVAASGDGAFIYGLTDTFLFSYAVGAPTVQLVAYTTSPAYGPRAIAVTKTGDRYLAGWGMQDSHGFLSEFTDPLGNLDTGGYAIDSDNGIVYAEVPSSTEPVVDTANGLPAPVLRIATLDNLQVTERINLPEHLAGKGVLSSDNAVMYAVSQSGLMILPVGQLSAAHRVKAAQGSLLFTSSACTTSAESQTLTITDPGGGATPFTLTSTTSGVTVSPSYGTTPATVRVTVDSSAFAGNNGTTAVTLKLASTSAVNIPDNVTVLVNAAGPEQRGTLVRVEGTLVDILPDPARSRFFVLRQNTNEVLVFDGVTYQQIGALRTGTTPTSMALSFDDRYLLVGNNDSHYANMFDLETLTPQPIIRFPGAHYPRWLAASGNAMVGHKATAYSTLGIYKNSINAVAGAVASPNGSTVLIAEADGNALLYNANSDSFTVSRLLSTALSGAIAASSYDIYAIDQTLYNASLVSQGALADFGKSSGFLFYDLMGIRTGAASASTAGYIQRINFSSGAVTTPTRLKEAPLLATADGSTRPFTRTLGMLADRSALVSLSTSGFTVLAWKYDTTTAVPSISSVVNAADSTSAVAPGGLIVVKGTNLATTTAATKELPLATALGETCLMVNGFPAPMILASSTQINAQMPAKAEGNVTMVLRTPGGTSDSYLLTVLPTAPSLFSTTVADDYSVARIIRESNGEVVTPANPIRANDVLTMYLTGMGATSPAVADGAAAPSGTVVLNDPEVSINGYALSVLEAGLVEGSVGVNYIKVQVPFKVPTGMNKTLLITQGGYSTSATVRVIN